MHHLEEGGRRASSRRPPPPRQQVAAAAHRSRAGGESARTTVTRGEEESGSWERGPFPKKRDYTVILQPPGFQHAVTGGTSRGDDRAGGVAAARLLRDRWERWAPQQPGPASGSRGQRDVCWSTGRFLTAKLTYLMNGWSGRVLVFRMKTRRTNHVT